MRKFDYQGLEFSKTQARLFGESINKYPGSSTAFVKTYMNCNTCEMIDRTNEFYIDELLNEIEKHKLIYKGNKKYHYDIMYWMGYLYRYWAYVYEETSKNIYKIIKCDELAKLYEPYHTLDPLAAIQRIKEAKNIPDKLSQVELYRKMFFNNTKNKNI